MSRYCDICGAALPKDERDRRIAELENRPHDEVLLHDMELMQKRIVELENAPYGGQGKLVAENALLTTRIAELEAENKLLRKTEGHYIGCPLRVKLAAGIAPMCTPCTCNEIANKKAEAAEAKLAKVEGLPGKWRWEVELMCTEIGHTVKHAVETRADELEALLKGARCE